MTNAHRKALTERQEGKCPRCAEPMVLESGYDADGRFSAGRSDTYTCSICTQPVCFRCATQLRESLAYACYECAPPEQRTLHGVWRVARGPTTIFDAINKRTTHMDIDGSVIGEHDWSDSFGASQCEHCDD